MRHLVRLPAASGLHPLLCFLHGYDEAAPAPPDEALTRWGPLRAGNPRSVAERFVVLAPQLPFAGDTWHRYADSVRSLVDAVIEKHGADRSRLYLTGFSFGANGVFDLAALQPDLWRALWAVDPTRVPERDPQRPVWLYFGEVARSRKARFVQALRLREAGAAAQGERMYTDEGDDHVGAARRAYADQRVYAWLLAQGA